MKTKLIISILSVALFAAIVGAEYAYARTSALNVKLNQANSSMTNLKKQLSQANSAIGEYQKQADQINSAENAILQKQLAQANTSITSLQAQLYEANAKIAGLQRIPNVTQKQVIGKDQIILQNANEKTLIADFVADHAGYIYINGYASTTQGYVEVNGTQYQVSTGVALQIPVVPGKVVAYYGNNNYMNSVTGTMTSVEFWY
jgi:seryl-tRNA synthetase